MVVKAAAIRYRAPLRDAFVCVALPPGAAALERFAADFRAQRKATLSLRVAVWAHADAAAGAALAQAEAEAQAQAGASGADTGATQAAAAAAAIVTPDGRKPACVLDGEFTAFVPAT